MSVKNDAYFKTYRTLTGHDKKVLSRFPERYFIFCTRDIPPLKGNICAAIEKYPGLNIYRKQRTGTNDPQLPEDAYETVLSQSGYCSGTLGYTCSVGFTKSQLLSIANKMDDLDQLIVFVIS